MQTECSFCGEARGAYKAHLCPNTDRRSIVRFDAEKWSFWFRHLLRVCCKPMQMPKLDH